MNVIYTIGHSTRPIEEFIDLLRAHQITKLVDIRTIPRSRHNPQYESSTLKDSLQAVGIKYVHLKELGGLRNSTPNSKNDGWHNKSFRNYADYMQTQDFKQGLDILLNLNQSETIAIMCAEAVPWRCHRSLVGDALIVRNMQVRHIISHKSPKDHKLTSFAVVDGTHITYPKSALTEAT